MEQENKKEKKKKKPLGPGRIIILIICAIVFFGCAGYLGLYMKQNMSAEKEFDNVSELKINGLEGVYAKNNDTVAWVQIDDTRIDYPVMQTPDEPQYYLYKDFNKEDSVPGTPFVDEASYIDVKGIQSDRTNTDNWLIHGHNIKAGTMFHDLLKYDDESFWKEHPTFKFDYITSVSGGKATVKEGECEIFACCRSRIRDKGEAGFRYYRCGGIVDEEAFNEYIAGVSEEALYDTGVTPKYGDQLVTLSTCAYHTDHGRFYVVAILK